MKRTEKKEHLLVVVFLDALCVLIWGTKTVLDFVIMGSDYSPFICILDFAATVIWLINFVKWYGRYKELKAQANAPGK